MVLTKTVTELTLYVISTVTASFLPSMRHFCRHCAISTVTEPSLPDQCCHCRVSSLPSLLRSEDSRAPDSCLPNERHRWDCRLSGGGGGEGGARTGRSAFHDKCSAPQLHLPPSASGRSGTRLVTFHYTQQGTNSQPSGSALSYDKRQRES